MSILHQISDEPKSSTVSITMMYLLTYLQMEMCGHRADLSRGEHQWKGKTRFSAASYATMAGSV